METVKTTYKKLTSGLTDIKDSAELEVKCVLCFHIDQTHEQFFRAIDDALEALSVLIAIRKAPPDTTQALGIRNTLCASYKQLIDQYR